MTHNPGIHRNQNMKTDSLPKLIKKVQPGDPETTVSAEPAADPKRLATEVRSWVGEFKKDRRSKTLPGFDSLFDDGVPASEGVD